MKKSMDMLNGPLFSSILKFSFPIIATGILQILYNNADIVIVGQFARESQNAVGAIGATSSIIYLIVNLFLGLSVGTNVALAQSIGRQDDLGSKRVVHTAISLSLICGVIMTIIGVAFSGTFLTWMDTPVDIFNQSLLYLKIYFLGMPASMIYNFGSAILRSKGDTKRPLVILSLSGIANVIFNCIFVIFFNMSVDGVAWATTIAQYISAIAILCTLFKEEGYFKLELSSLKLSKNESLTILRYGIPAGFTSVMFNISNIFIQTALNAYNNPDILDGSAAASGLEGFVYTTMNSFSQAAMTFVGQNAGARNFKRIPKIYGTCAAVCVGLGIIMGWAMYLVGEPLLRVYLPTTSPEGIDFGMLRLACILLFYFLCGLMEVQMGVIRGLGYSSIPTTVTILTICVFRILWLYTIYPLFNTLASLYICYPISWLLSVVVLEVVYRIKYKSTTQLAATINEP